MKLLRVPRHTHNLIVVLRGSTDNHLCALPGGHKLRRFAVDHQFILVLRDAILIWRMGRESCVLICREQAVSACLPWKLKIDAHAVRKKSCLFNQCRVSAGDRFYVDVAVEVMDGTEPVERLVNQIHGVIDR